MKIICFGDSNTYGYDPRGFLGGRYEDDHRWVDLLGKLTGWETVNAGANGRQIPCHPFAQPLPDVQQTDIFLVMLGTNDLLQGATAHEAANRMEAFLRFVKPSCRQILLLSPTPMKRGSWVPTEELVAQSLQIGAEYRALAQKLDILYAHTDSWNIELGFDGVHFTENGHHLFARQLADCLSRL